VREDQLDHQDLKVFEVKLECLDLMDHQEKLVLRELQDTRDPLDL